MERKVNRTDTGSMEEYNALLDTNPLVREDGLAIDNETRRWLMTPHDPSILIDPHQRTLWIEECKKIDALLEEVLGDCVSY